MIRVGILWLQRLPIQRCCTARATGTFRFAAVSLDAPLLGRGDTGWCPCYRSGKSLFLVQPPRVAHHIHGMATEGSLKNKYAVNSPLCSNPALSRMNRYRPILTVGVFHP